MRELNPKEVLRIAGGQPVSAALDETSYLAPASPAIDVVDYARLLEAASRPSGPA
jgi:hypothetical protein